MRLPVQTHPMRPRHLLCVLIYNTAALQFPLHNHHDCNDDVFSSTYVVVYGHTVDVSPTIRTLRTYRFSLRTVGNPMTFFVAPGALCTVLCTGQSRQNQNSELVHMVRTVVRNAQL